MMNSTNSRLQLGVLQKLWFEFVLHVSQEV
jgi:hypothetical protein